MMVIEIALNPLQVKETCVLKRLVIHALRFKMKSVLSPMMLR